MARALTGRLARDGRGTVMIEFLIAFMPVFVLFLGTVQLVMISVADLVVRHAAVMSARSASVVLAEEAKYYAGEPVGAVREDGGSPDTGLLSVLGVGAEMQSVVPLLAGAVRHPGPRLAAIRRAASIPLAAIAPDPSSLARMFSTKRPSLRDELGDTPLARIESALLVYDALASAVTLPVAPKSDLLNGPSVPMPGDVTVRVTYMFHCGVPLGAALLCSTYTGLRLAAFSLFASDGEGNTRALKELEHAPASASQSVLLLSSARFRLLRAEATLPVQYAAYATQTGGQ